MPNKKMRLALCSLALLLALPSLTLAREVTYEYKTIPAGGKWGQCEPNRENAFKWALIDMQNQANDDCSDLGDGWRFHRIDFEGYRQAFACKHGGFKAEFERGIAQCKRLQRQR